MARDNHLRYILKRRYSVGRDPFRSIMTFAQDYSCFEICFNYPSSALGSINHVVFRDWWNVIHPLAWSWWWWELDRFLIAKEKPACGVNALCELCSCRSHGPAGSCRFISISISILALMEASFIKELEAEGSRGCVSRPWNFRWLFPYSVPSQLWFVQASFKTPRFLNYGMSSWGNWITQALIPYSVTWSRNSKPKPGFFKPRPRQCHLWTEVYCHRTWPFDAEFRIRLQCR